MAVKSRRSNAEIIFCALIKGIVIEKDGYRYVIRDRNFGILAREPKDLFLGLDWPLSSFIRWCDSQFTDKEVFAIAGDITLNDLQRAR